MEGRLTRQLANQITTSTKVGARGIRGYSTGDSGAGGAAGIGGDLGSEVGGVCCAFDERDGLGRGQEGGEKKQLLLGKSA